METWEREGQQPGEAWIMSVAFIQSNLQSWIFYLEMVASLNLSSSVFPFTRYRNLITVILSASTPHLHHSTLEHMA